MRYRFLELIGSGAFARVYKAVPEATGVEFDSGVEIKTDQFVAVKVVEKAGITADQGRAVRKEADLMKRLNHPNILKIIELLDLRDKFLLVSEYMECDLFSHIASPIPEPLTRHIIVELLNALVYLHGRGVVHRDVKLENVLTTFELNEQSPIKLCDFGLSKEIKNRTTETPCGTLAYSAPEVQRALKYNTSIDDWALGCLMFSCLSATPPFYESAHTPMRMRIVCGDFDFLGPVWDSISLEAKDLICGLINVNQGIRLSAELAIKHPWVWGLKMTAFPYLDTHVAQMSRVKRERTEAWENIDAEAIFHTPMMPEMREYFERHQHTLPPVMRDAAGFLVPSSSGDGSASDESKPMDISMINLATPIGWDEETYSEEVTTSAHRFHATMSSSFDESSLPSEWKVFEGLKPVPIQLSEAAKAQMTEPAEKVAKETLVPPAQEPNRARSARFESLSPDFILDIRHSTILVNRSRGNPSLIALVMSYLVEYLEPEMLKTLLKGTRSPQDFVVVDVRGDDYKFGNIPGALNIPSHLFLDHPQVYLDQLRPYARVIFHCALSQVRGPKCAQRYATILSHGDQGEVLSKATPPPQQQQILVLRGGFEEWQRLFREDSGLVENYDATYWANPW